MLNSKYKYSNIIIKYLCNHRLCSCSLGVEGPDCGVLGCHVLCLGRMGILYGSLVLDEIAVKCARGSSFAVDSFDELTRVRYVMILVEIECGFVGHRTHCCIPVEGLIKLWFVVEHSFILLFLLIGAFVIYCDMAIKNVPSQVACPVDIFAHLAKPSVIGVMVDIVRTIWQHLYTFLCQLNWLLMPRHNAE